MSTEDLLRAGLRRHADDIVVPHDVYDGVAQRCRRDRRRRAAGAAIVACAVVLLVVPVTRSVVGDGRDPDAVASPVQAYPLPPRGPLATDGTFLAEVVRAPWGSGPDALQPPTATRQVVYAADVGGHRWAKVVGTVDGQLMGVWLQGPEGAAGNALTLQSEPQPVGPGPEVYSDYADGTTVVFVIGQPGDQVSLSERANIDATGTVSRDYTPVDTLDGVAAVALSGPWQPALGAKVDRGSATVYRGSGSGGAQFGPDDQPRQWTDAAIAAAATEALGEPPEPALARQVLDQLTGHAGYTLDEVRPTVLYAGPAAGDGQVLLLSAILPSGAVAILGGGSRFDSEGNPAYGGPGLLELHPAGTSVADLLVVMRSDFYDGSGPIPFDSELVVLGPVGSATFQVGGIDPNDEQTQDGRIVRIHPGENVNSVQALDADGTVLADGTVGGVADVRDLGDGPGD
ncbi:MAG: hypothetical protein ACR2HA_08755 [Nocardioides sp.]